MMLKQDDGSVLHENTNKIERNWNLFRLITGGVHSVRVRIVDNDSHYLLFSEKIGFAYK